MSRKHLIFIIMNSINEEVKKEIDNLGKEKAVYKENLDKSIKKNNNNNKFCFNFKIMKFFFVESQI